jgi:hypothetical protein
MSFSDSPAPWRQPGGARYISATSSSSRKGERTVSCDCSSDSRAWWCHGTCAKAMKLSSCCARASRQACSAPGSSRANAGLEERGLHLARPEGEVATQDLRAVVAGQAHRCDLAGQAVDVQLHGAGDVHLAVGEVHGARGQDGEAAQEVASHAQRAVRLPAGLRHATREQHVHAVAHRPSEGVAGQGAGGLRRPGHEQAARPGRL